MLLTNNTPYSVLLPEDPTPREAFAGEELSKYLTRILGHAPCEGGIPFVIGGPTRNAAAGEFISAEELATLLTGDEGYLIRITERGVLLAGSEGRDDDERGTLYAVYELLEGYFGCVFAAYSAPWVDAGEIVPTLSEVTLPEGDCLKAGADLSFRAAIPQYGCRAGNPKHGLNLAFIDYLAKNRYNRIYVWGSTYLGYCRLGVIEELTKRGIRLLVGHHEALWLFLPYYGNPCNSEHYIETHPEFFRLQADGTRFKPRTPDDHEGQWVLCSRNEECIETVARNMIEWMKKNPIVDMVSLLMYDGIAEGCCCPACAPYSKTENYLYFVREVAKRVAAELPYAKIQMGAYVDVWKCPENIVLSPNVMVMVSTWASFGLRMAGKPDGSCLVGTDYEDTIVGWHEKAGASVQYYDYHMGVFSNRQRVIPMADELQAIWRSMKEKGIDGSSTQMECFNLWNHLLNFYAFARTGYDTSLTLDDHIASLCRLFGEGGEEIAEILRHFEEVYDGQEDVAHGGIYLMQNADLPRVYRLFDAALEKAVSARCRNNVRLLRMAVRHSELDTADKTNEVWDWTGAHREYDDPTGELAYIATNFESFKRNDPGYGIACPALNTDTKGFVPDRWYTFE